MSGWPSIELASAARVLRGVSFGAADATLDRRPGSIACLTTAAVKAEPNWGAARYVPSSLVKDEQLLRPGDILVSTSNSAETVGRSCLISSVPEIATFGAFVTVARPDPEVFDPRFLAAWMRSGTYQAAIDRLKTRTTNISNLRSSDLGRLRVPLPPLDEQRRIAAHLTIATGETRTARDAAEARRSDLDDLRSSTITAAFRAASRAVATSLGSIGRLADGDWILTADYAPSGVRLLQVGDVGRGRLSIKSNRHITETRATELNCTLLAPGDVLISRMPEPLGRACVLPDLGYPCITAVDVTIMRIDPTKADLDYLTGYLNSPEWYAAVAAKSSGATRARISRKNLELLTVPLSSLADQRRIAARLREQLAEIDRVKAALQAQRSAIDALPAALLREVFGEVNAARAEVNAARA